MNKKIFWTAIFFIFSNSCQFEDIFLGDKSDPNSDVRIEDVGGNPSPGSLDIYSFANLKDLCVDDLLCKPDYEPVPSDWIQTSNQEPLDQTKCNFDYDPNLTSTFKLRQVDGGINGFEMALSKQDLFFLAWVSVRYQINPYFLLAVMSRESALNCAAVSNYHGEGCFQITNTFGQGQLNDSYFNRVENWFWSDRSGTYYPDKIFVDERDYFGFEADGIQFRMTKDPESYVIEGIKVSSVVNFHFGIIASALYFHWQPLFLYYYFDDIRDEAENLFNNEDGKALWQAAAYNGGAFGAGLALEEAGENFLDEMFDETQNYAPEVVETCHQLEEGELAYEQKYTLQDLEDIIDFLSQTYSNNEINWNDVKAEVAQIFFTEGIEELSFVDDIKAIVYVISTHTYLLAPEWPDEDSI